MKTLSRKITSLLLAMSMIFSLCPSYVFADDIKETDIISDESDAEQELILEEPGLDEAALEIINEGDENVENVEVEEILTEAPEVINGGAGFTEPTEIGGSCMADTGKKNTAEADEILFGSLPEKLNEEVDTIENIYEATNKDAQRYTVLVLDRSGEHKFYSSYPNLIYTAGTALDEVKTAANAFLDSCHDTKNNHVAIVSYADGAVADSGFTSDVSYLRKCVNGLSEGEEAADVSAALDEANGLLSTVTDRNAIKNVVLFTSGLTNTGKYNYTGHYDSNTIGSNWMNLATSIKLYAYANEGYNSAEVLKNDNTNIYVIGLFNIYNGMPEEGREVAAFFRLFAYDLASKANMFYTVTDPKKLKFVFEDVSEEITGAGTKFKFAGMTTDGKTDTESKYYYEDNYFFNKPASEYYNSLATMSLCLELSTWPSYEYSSEGNRWYDKNKQPTDPLYYEDTLKNVKTLLLGSPYEKERENGYAGIGFTDFMASKDWSKKPGRNTVGAVAARKQITDPNDGKKYTMVALVVRGGGYESEWSGNFNVVGDVDDHKGFTLAKEEVLRFLKNDYLPTLRSDESKNLKIWLTGYSRAGATANMVAGAIDGGELSSSGFTFNPANDLYCYTFEAPMGVDINGMTTDQLGGNEAYANIHNVRNVNDFVPLVAPKKWDFAKYAEKSDHILPNHNNANWQEKYDAMINQFERMGFDSDDWYNVKEGVVELDYEKFKLGFIETPLGHITNKTIYTDTFLNDMMDFLAKDVLGTKTFYKSTLQASVETLTAIFLGSEKDDIRDAFFDDFMSKENVMYILAPIFSINPFKSQEAKITEMEIRIGERAEEFLKDNGIYTDDLKVALVTVFLKVYTKVALDKLANNDNSLDNILSFAQLLSKEQITDIYGDINLSDVFTRKKVGSLANAHYPEVCLAWLRSEDPNYNYSVVEETPSDASLVRIVRINCPVDVEVTNADGDIIVKIVNDEVKDDFAGYEDRATIDSSGEKVLYLPGDGEYNINIKATGTGTVHYSVDEFDFYEGAVKEKYIFNGVAVSNGTRLSAKVPNVMTEDILSGDEDAPKYEFINGSTPVAIDEQLSGDDVVSYDVEANIPEASKGKGQITGAGSYIKGEFAQLEAMPYPGATFDGWYVGDDRQSDKQVYRFKVDGNATYEARFTGDVSFHDATFTTSDGGKIMNTNDKYASGMKIAIKAYPDKGYYFKEWVVKQRDESIIDDLTNEDAILTMPNSDIEIKANFEEIVNAEKLEIKQKNFSLYVGESAKIEAKIVPENATYSGIVYRSLDDRIASVDAEGNIYANSIGKTMIEVISGDGKVKEICNVRVKRALTVSGMDPTVKPDSNNYVYLVVGKTCDLGPGNYSISRYQKRYVKLKGGKATGKKVGFASIRNKTTSTSYSIYVYKPKLRFGEKLDKKSLSSSIGKTANVGITGIPEYYASHYPVAWHSSNERVIKVVPTGGMNAKVTCIGKGSAYVYAYIQGKKYQAKVKVSDGIKAEYPKEIDGIYKETHNVMLNPLQATAIRYKHFIIKNATWTSSDAAMTAVPGKKLVTDGVVQIDTNTGKITAIGEGTSQLQAKDSSGRVIKINVSTVPMPSNPIVYVTKGKTAQLSARGMKANKSTFVVDNDKIASVDNKGKVTGLDVDSDGINPGFTYVTCTYKPVDYSAGFTYDFQVFVQSPSLATDEYLSEAGSSNGKVVRSIVLKQGESYDLVEQYRGIAQTILWNNSKSSIAYVDEYGNIRANDSGKAGETTLSAKFGGVTLTVKVKVNN